MLCENIEEVVVRKAQELARWLRWGCNRGKVFIKIEARSLIEPRYLIRAEPYCRVQNDASGACAGGAGRVTSVADLSNLNQMLAYPGLWVDLREDTVGTLTATEYAAVAGQNVLYQG